jgi:hypothetical protein
VPGASRRGRARLLLWRQPQLGQVVDCVLCAYRREAGGEPPPTAARSGAAAATCARRLAPPRCWARATVAPRAHAGAPLRSTHVPRGLLQRRPRAGPPPPRRRRDIGSAARVAAHGAPAVAALPAPALTTPLHRAPLRAATRRCTPPLHAAAARRCRRRRRCAAPQLPPARREPVSGWGAPPGGLAGPGTGAARASRLARDSRGGRGGPGLSLWGASVVADGAGRAARWGICGSGVAPGAKAETQNFATPPPRLPLPPVMEAGTALLR